MTPIIVEDLIDPMSVPMTTTHFSADVENIMMENRDVDAAALCHAVRSWWRAEDEPGISGLERIEMRMALRNRLLENVDFGHFPPSTMYIKVWQSQLWEAFVANIDAKSILYTPSKKGCL